MTQKPTILLYGLKSIGLIIPCSSGVIYQNQTGGYCCFQNAEEGVFVPLENEPIDHSEALYDFFFRGKWGGHCSNGIDIETADFIDDMFTTSPVLSGIKVDRSRLDDSHEAWVYVILADPTSTGLLKDFDTIHGILTWPNSD